MDIYSYIEKDHRAVADLMQQVLDTRDAKRRMELFNRIRAELIVHLDSEESNAPAAPVRLRSR